MEVSLVFPHQLFQNHPAVTKDRKVILVEDPLFFGNTRYHAHFHAQKLILHKASMAFYADFLKKAGYNIELWTVESLVEGYALASLFQQLQLNGIKALHVCEPYDFYLSKALSICKEKGIQLTLYPNPQFLTTAQDFKEVFQGKKTLSQQRFYMHVRKKWEILTEPDGSPVGGQWSLDAENRKRLPKGYPVPFIYKPIENRWVKDAKIWLKTSGWPKVGDYEYFRWPTTFEEAEKGLEDFLLKRFTDFGPYEDFMDKDQPFLFHSLLSVPLNLGLLTPDQVINKALAIAQQENVPLQSVEGFVRQVIGWREFVGQVYLQKGVEQRNSNFWNFTNPMPKGFYTGVTGLENVDAIFPKIITSGYLHHIERLMVFGNLFLLLRIHPHYVYQWFMDWFIDAYDWVMVPNVYGMSQYADGGLMCSKPYISGSNYLNSMGNYPKGHWNGVWDALFWCFVHDYADVFMKNPRTSMMAVTVKKKDMKPYLTLRDSFLEKLYG